MRLLLLDPRLNYRSLMLQLERLVVVLVARLVGRSCTRRSSRIAGDIPLAYQVSASVTDSLR
jgi:hypothetical protein